MGFRFVFIAVLAMTFFSCQVDTPQHKKRPREVWVLRSVLDRTPRMLTLALDSNCYVAYDVARCQLSKAWKGGIILQGAAYTNQPNLQPVSWGTSYSEKLASKWQVDNNGRQDSFHLVNRGYRFKDGRVHLKFDLILSSNDTIRIEESPEVITKENTLGLERRFMLSGVPGGITISLTDDSTHMKLKNNAVTTLVTWFTSPLQEQASTLDLSDHIGRNYMDKSDCFTCHETDRQNVGPSFQQVAKRYKTEKGAIEKLIARVKEGGTGVWGKNVMTSHPDLTQGEIRYMVEYILSLESSEEEVIEDVPSTTASRNTSPGDGAPLVGVHPSFDLKTIHKDNFKPRVGGMAFMPDGRLVVTTWDSVGGVYILDGVETGDTNKISVKRIAAGLAEPLGLEVVNGDIYVLQKHELTRLIDHDGDELTDEYASVCNSWGATADFHEFAFGLQYKDGYFYATLSMAMRLLSTEKQLPDRGTVIRIAPNGHYERVIYGLRQPNGISLGPGDEIFITDNQGQWLPASKLIHVKKGEYHGMRWGVADSVVPPPMALPAIWMPEDEIANSPSQPVLIKNGIYKGQMLHGDVTAGGIQRDFLEKVDGEYQGCIFRFTQGLETGVNRLKIGPDSAVYIGGLGLVGGWSYKGRQHGLQKMQYNGTPTFEMLAIRAKPYGFEIEMTEAIGLNAQLDPHKITIQQWWYMPTASYGGPKMDVEKLAIKKMDISTDRKRLQLHIEGLRKEHVVYFRLPKWTSETNRPLWTTESWYTLNRIPR